MQHYTHVRNSTSRVVCSLLICVCPLELVFIGDWWSGSRVILYIDKDDFKKYWGKEHACCVMNHTYEIDWLIGWMLCDRLELLGVSLNHCCFLSNGRKKLERYSQIRLA